MIARPTAVVFDLDGLMFNTEQVYQLVATELLGRRGKAFSLELHHAMMGRPARDGLKIMIDWCQLTETMEELATESSDIFVTMLDSHVAPMPGLVELLDALEAQAIPKAVATSSGRSWVLDLLGRFGFEGRFEFYLCAEDVTHGKPHPEIYQKAAARLGRAPHEVLVLEDSQTGFQAAYAAGTIAVAVPGEHNAGHRYDGARLIVDSLADPRLYAELGLG